MGGANGRKQPRTQLSDWRDGLTDVEVAVDRMAIDGVEAAVEWHFDARHSGVVVLDGGHALRTHRKPRDHAFHQ